MKVCTKCGEEKPLTEFHKKGLKRDGSPRLQTECKACKAIRDSETWRRIKAKKPKKTNYWPDDHIPESAIKLSRMAWL